MSNSYIFELDELYQYLMYKKRFNRIFKNFMRKHLFEYDVLIYIKTIKLLIYLIEIILILITICAIINY